MPMAIFPVWGAHAPSRVLFGASPKSLIQTPTWQIDTFRKSSRSRGRDRQHARRVRSPIQIAAQ
jgi:hypothetical protein